MVIKNTHIHEGVFAFCAIVRADAGLILSLRPPNKRRRYKVTPSLIGWAQT